MFEHLPTAAAAASPDLTMPPKTTKTPKGVPQQPQDMAAAPTRSQPARSGKANKAANEEAEGRQKGIPRYVLCSYPYFFDLIYFYMYRSMSTRSKTKAADLEETVVKEIVGSVPPHFYLSRTDSVLCFNYLDLLQGPRKCPSRLKILPPKVLTGPDQGAAKGTAKCLPRIFFVHRCHSHCFKLI